MKKIVLTSCGIINGELKKSFYNLLNKDISELKLLYITIAVDGELDDDRAWLEEEYATILDLGIKEENITQYKYDKDIDFCDFDAIYMMGGNTFYLLKELKEKSIDDKLRQAIEKGIIYIGSSAGSVIMGNSVETSLPFDENWVKIQDFTGLGCVDADIIPHANRKQEFIAKLKDNRKIIQLLDDDGIVIDE